MANNYDGNSISVLEGLDPVRKRPGMYIGSVGTKGLNHLIYEIVDNSVDEHLAGYCSEITVTLEKDGSATVEDNGRGIPVDINEQVGRPAVEVVFTTLHAGGKFGDGNYKISGGLHGVGSSVVNALSLWLEVNVKRDGKIYNQRYEQGKVCYDLKEAGKCRKNDTGTKVSFFPAFLIFADFSAQLITFFNVSKFLSKNNVSCSPAIDFVTFSASGLSSLVFVCPSNLGSGCFTATTATRPFLTSAPVKLLSFSFNIPSSLAY